MLYEVFVRLFMELLIFKSSLFCLVFLCLRLMIFIFRGYLDFVIKLVMGKIYIFLNFKETILYIKVLLKCVGSFIIFVILMLVVIKYLNSIVGK